MTPAEINQAAALLKARDRIQAVIGAAAIKKPQGSYERRVLEIQIYETDDGDDCGGEGGPGLFLDLDTGDELLAWLRVRLDQKLAELGVTQE